MPELLHNTFYSSRMGKQVHFRIYLPPEYETEQKAYPVLYRVWDAMEAESDIRKAVGVADQAIRSGRIPPMVIVLFKGGREDAFIQELIPFIDREYRTAAEREGRAIEGAAAGGYAALRLAVKYNTHFSSVISYEGNGDESQQKGLFSLMEDCRNEILGKLHIRLVSSEADSCRLFSDNFHCKLDELRIPHQYKVFGSPSKELSAYYAAFGEDGLHFHTEAFLIARYEDLTKPTDNVVMISNLPYCTVDGGPMLLDLYLPDQCSEPVPVILWIHGGGWAAHSKEYYVPCWMVEHGYAVASMNYRLSHQKVFPAQLVDCKAAVRWLKAHGGEYNLDTARIAAWGNSAGGHLAALLGTTGNTRDYDEGNDLEFSSNVQAVCDYYGPIDLSNMNHPEVNVDHNASDSMASLLLGAPIAENPELAALANPITYLKGSVPPFLIVHGNKDNLVHHSQSVLLYEALKRAGADAALHIIEDAEHGFEVFHRVPEAENAVKSFFACALKQG